MEPSGEGLDDFSGGRGRADELGAGLMLAVAVGVGGLGGGEVELEPPPQQDPLCPNTVVTEDSMGGWFLRSLILLVVVSALKEAFAQDGGVGGGCGVDKLACCRWRWFLCRARAKDAVRAMAGDGVARGVVVVSPLGGLCPVHRVRAGSSAEKQVGGEVAGFQVEGYFGASRSRRW